MVKELKKLFGIRKSSKKRNHVLVTQKDLKNRVNQATTRAIKEYGGAFKRLADYDRS